MALEKRSHHPTQNLHLGKRKGKKKVRKKKKAALQLCHVRPPRAVQAEWKIALTPNKTCVPGQGSSPGSHKDLSPSLAASQATLDTSIHKEPVSHPSFAPQEQGTEPSCSAGMCSACLGCKTEANMVQ